MAPLILPTIIVSIALYLGLAKIGLKADLKYSPPKGDAGLGLFKISRGNLKSEGARGTLFFDLDKHAERTSSLALEALQTCHRYAQALQQAMDGLADG